jgi:RNA polymerase sigma-70 factor (ECF subfamily)
LSLDAQVALTLREVCGLTSPEIARAFLVPVTTVQQRLVRAKRKIREARIPFGLGDGADLDGRLGAVAAVIYLIFTEGHAATEGDRVLRPEVCDEAIRLGRLVAELAPTHGEIRGLLALMLLQDARRDARVDAAGRLVPLDEQDRRRWDRAKIAEGTVILNEVLRSPPVGPYAVQAAIAAVHAEAATAADTDWPQITVLYRALHALNPSPTVRVAWAVAATCADQLPLAATLLASVDDLDGHAPRHLAAAELARRSGDLDAGRASLGRAIDLTTNEAERAWLRAKRDGMAR